VTALIRATDVVKSFGSVEALRGVTFQVDPAEVVVLLGRNGAGKSTLLRILGTRVVQDAGEVAMAGADVRHDPRLVRRRTGVVLADERSWYWPLTGRANLEFFARLGDLSRRQARERVAELLDLVDLTDSADRRVAGYSSGMRARLSLARALLLEPSVLLMDEPSRALDHTIARELRSWVVGLARSSGCAVLWVTHDLHEAAVVADRVLVLDHGRLVYDEAGPRDAESLARLLDAS
jgi:ABC-type multidrug transport system ATPase subunit